MDTARDCLERAADLGPTNIDLLAWLVHIRREEDRASVAEKALDLCDQVRPGYAEAYSAMAWTYTAGYGNDPQASEALLRRADACQPEWAKDEIKLAGVVDQLSADAAERHYRQAAAMAPDFFPFGWQQIADGLAELSYDGADARQHEAAALDFAEECIDRSIEQLPTICARTTAAKVLARRRDYEAAGRQLLEIVKQRPTSSNALILLGGTQRCLEKWPEAEKTFRAAIKAMKPRGPDQEWLAVYQCMTLDGRGDEARRELETQRQTHGAYFEAVGDFQIASCYLAMLEVDKAEALYRKFPEFEGGTYRLDNMALCRIHRDDWNGALELFEESYNGPGKGEVEPALGLAVCQYKLGDRQAALKFYREADQIDHRWLLPEGLREQLWPPKGIEAFEQLQAEWQKAR